MISNREDIEMDYLNQPEQSVEYGWGVGACIGFFTGSVTGPICALKSGIVLAKAISFGVCLGGVAGAITGGIAGVAILASCQIANAAFNNNKKLVRRKEREPMNIISDNSLNLAELPYYIYGQNFLPFLDIETIENLYNVNRKFRQIIKNVFRTNPRFLVNEINEYRLYNYSLSLEILRILQSQMQSVSSLTTQITGIYLIENYGLDFILLSRGYSFPSAMMLMPVIIPSNIIIANRLMEMFKEECVIRTIVNSTNEDMFEHRIRTRNDKIKFSDVLKMQLETFMIDDETNRSNYKNNAMLLFSVPRVADDNIILNHHLDSNCPRVGYYLNAS